MPPIIFEKGDTFWIEFVDLPVSLTDAAGIKNGTVVNLEKPGIFLGATIVSRTNINDDNTQGVGNVGLSNGANTALTLGLFITDVRVRVTKIIGTDGASAANYTCLLFMRGRG